MVRPCISWIHLKSLKEVRVKIYGVHVNKGSKGKGLRKSKIHRLTPQPQNFHLTFKSVIVHVNRITLPLQKPNLWAFQFNFEKRCYINWRDGFIFSNRSSIIDAVSLRTKLGSEISFWIFSKPIFCTWACHSRSNIINSLKTKYPKMVRDRCTGYLGWVKEKNCLKESLDKKSSSPFFTKKVFVPLFLSKKIFVPVSLIFFEKKIVYALYDLYMPMNTPES